MGCEARLIEGAITTDSARKAVPDTIDAWAEPAKHYPFSHGETNSVIAPYALSAVMLCIMNNDPGFKFDFGDGGAVVAILGRMHAHHGRISSRHKGELERRIRAILRQMARTNPDFDDHLGKLRSWRLIPAAIRRFNAICRRIAKSYAEQERLDRCVLEGTLHLAVFRGRR